MERRWFRPGVEFAEKWAQEEMGELNAAMGKAGRWGYGNSDPTKPPEQRIKNIDWVLKEIRDAVDALHNLEAELLTNLGTLRNEIKNEEPVDDQRATER